MKRTLAFAILLIGVAPATNAQAHLELLTPSSRYGGQVLKVGPCGMPNGARGDDALHLEPGAELTIRWNEYVDHPGHYRVAFDADGDDDFVDPVCTADCTTTSPKLETYGDPTVLLDGIEDHAGGDYEVEVTLPDIECDECTIQIIQVMYDKPPYETPGNDIYYQCIDVVLERGGGGCVCTGRRGRLGGLALLGGALLLSLIRRRQRRRCAIATSKS